MSAAEWVRGAVAGALALGLALPAEAQLRPRPRPDTLVIPSPVEDVVPASVAGETAEEVFGAETNLPLPRFVSLKTDEGNARRGPALDQKIDWVFVREDMPLRITAEYGHWRRVEDRDGEGGWVHYSLLSGTRTVIVDRDRLPLQVSPEEGSQGIALLSQGVVARLEACGEGWCRIAAGGYGGWVPDGALWGVEPGEAFEE